jgi:UDP-GlcNAc3NAcA epimerase
MNEILKIITVVGARPQFIKAAVLSRAIARYNDLHPNAQIRELILHTGQHFDEQMSDIFFREMNIPKPDFQFSLNRLPHGAMTGRMLEHIEGVLIDEKPDLIVVYGDTNSTLAGALAASKCGIPIVHVEAGLRSYNMSMPEEINRILTDRVSSILCCPSKQSVDNLRLEGFDQFDVDVVMTGDVMYDAALFYSDLSDRERQSTPDKLNLPEQYLLATIHRAENTDDFNTLSGIVEGLNTIHRHTPVVLTLHPRTKAAIDRFELNVECIVLPPLGYFDMLRCIKDSEMIITDSGGLQKEAYFFQKPCITVRSETEWVELVEQGYNILAGTKASDILAAVKEMSAREFTWSSQLYGDGHAGEHIVDLLLAWKKE